MVTLKRICDRASRASGNAVNNRGRAYLVAVTVTVVGVTASLPLQRTVDRFPYLPLLVAAVIISAWAGGLGPGLLAAGGGALAAEFLIVGGLQAVGTHPDLLAQLALFVAVAALATSLRASRMRASAIRRDRLLWEVEERLKELTLLHRATRLLQEDTDVETLLGRLVGLLSAGWQFPELLEARITVAEVAVVATPGFRITPWTMRAEFPMYDGPPGFVEVVYREPVPADVDGPFLPDERKLLDSLASLLASYLERVQRVQERLELARAHASQIEAEAANRMKDAFLATVSHELRRPLTAILGWTRMLQEADTDRARGLEVIERNARIQLRLIEELLDWSRTGTGRPGIAFSLVDLNVILQAVADAARPAAADRGVEVVTRFGGGDVAVLGDGMRLQQIAGNLVGNAIKFTPDGGRVMIALERSGEEARIVVADTGIGIAATQLPHIFDTFWQADASTSAAREGLGLGLSIVRRLVEWHGGRIEAASAGAGGGTRMTVTLPLAPDGVTRDADS